MTTTTTTTYAIDLSLAEYDPDCVDFYTERAMAIAPDLVSCDFYDERPDLVDRRVSYFARPRARFVGPASALEAIYVRWYLGGYDDPTLVAEMAGASLADVRVFPVEL